MKTLTTSDRIEQQRMEIFKTGLYPKRLYIHPDLWIELLLNYEMYPFLKDDKNFKGKRYKDLDVIEVIEKDYLKVEGELN